MNDDWKEYKRLVLAEVKRSVEQDEKHGDAINALKTELAVLKTKVIFIASALTVALNVGIGILLWWLKK